MALKHSLRIIALSDNLWERVANAAQGKKHTFTRERILMECSLD
jgi:hypothetical protein